MEINLSNQIPVLAGSNNQLATIPSTAPLPVESSFVEALSGIKIKEATDLQLKAAVSAAVEKAWFDLGLKAIPDEDYKRLKLNIVTEFRDCWSSMTLNEIGNAFHQWSRGKYGKVYSLTVAVAGKLMSDYLTDHTRLQAVQSTRPKELPAPKPSPEHLFNQGKELVLMALEKHNSKTPLATLAPTVYNFLDKLGLIIYTKQEKWDFMQKGLLGAIDELRVMIAIATDGHKISGLKKQLNLLLEANKPDTPLKDADCLILVKNKAKELTLADWFDTCADSEFEVDKLVEGKRESYLKIS